MKKICYYFLFCIILSCSKDEAKAREIQFSYAETESNTTFRVAGSWEILPNNSFLVSFVSNLSGGTTTYMRSSLSNSINQPRLSGTYGSSIDENQDIEDAIGAFRFIWD